jgi:hypothetical protein
MPRWGVGGIAIMGVWGRSPDADIGVAARISTRDSRRALSGIGTGVEALMARSVYRARSVGCKTTVEIFGFFADLLR